MHQRTDFCPNILAFKPPRIAASLMLAAAALQLAAPMMWPPLVALLLAGFLAGILGFAIMLRAWWLFRIADTAVCPTAPTTDLITTDIYRLSRNPMYLGIVLMMLGVGIATGSPPFYLAAVAFFLIIDFAFCPYEERKLERAFGSRFTSYCDEVRRWL